MDDGRRLRYVLFTTVYFVEGALLTFFGFNALSLALVRRVVYPHRHRRSGSR